MKKAVITFLSLAAGIGSLLQGQSKSTVDDVVIMSGKNNTRVQVNEKVTGVAKYRM